MASKLPSQSQPLRPDVADPKPAPRFNPTALAITGAMVIAVVLTSIFINPFSALQRAYQGLESPKPIESEAAATPPGDQAR